MIFSELPTNVTNIMLAHEKSTRRDASTSRNGVDHTSVLNICQTKRFPDFPVLPLQPLQLKSLFEIPPYLRHNSRTTRLKKSLPWLEKDLRYLHIYDNYSTNYYIGKWTVIFIKWFTTTSIMSIHQYNESGLFFVSVRWLHGECCNMVYQFMVYHERPSLEDPDTDCCMHLPQLCQQEPAWE